MLHKERKSLQTIESYKSMVQNVSLCELSNGTAELASCNNLATLGITLREQLVNGTEKNRKA